MRQTLYLIFIAFILYSCGNQSGNTKISGKLENAKSENVIIEELTLAGKKYSDTVELTGSGKFRFKINIEDPAFYKLKVGEQRGITIIVRPEDKIYITGDASNLYATYEIEGSDESTYAQALDRRMDKTVKGIDSLNTVYRQFLNNPNIVNITKTLQNNYYRLLDEQRQFTVDFIQKHPASLASIIALYQQTDDSVFVLYKAEDTKYYALVDSMLYPKYPKASYVKALHSNLENIKAQHNQEQLKKIMSALGSPAQDFNLPGTTGKNVALSSFKGSPLLLYFWASWCDSCRNNNPAILELQNKYRRDGLKVLAVSLDTNKDVWTNAINKDKISSWTHVSDLKYWNSPIVSKYNIENVPLYFLLDKEGTIISRSYSLNSIDDRLALLFKE
ncbi:MAG: AhpC/TSA family protein [Bacteroidales bacterium]|nr:AhpC/TSA family protein [Bacteroidales bacterium]